MSERPTPANTAPAEDVGAETQFRFAYQAAYTAILALSLLDESTEFVELFSEHHEDILLKSRDGKFQGIQVKTRGLGGAPWKTTDDEVLNSLARFVRLDSQFPGHFSKFVLATNHFFFEASRNGNNLPFLLEEAGNATDWTTAPSIVKRVVKKLANRTGLDEVNIFNTLRKTRATADLPKLKDSMNVLRENIYQIFPAAQQVTRPVLEQAATRLQEAMRAASSLDHRDALPGYFALLNNADSVESHLRIAGKLFTAEKVRRILDEVLGERPLLVPGGATSITHDGTRTKMKQKLEAGGFSVVSLNLATDLSAAALTRLLEWRERFGEKEALRRYNHLKILVLQDCADAHEESKGAPAPFGRTMLQNLRARLNARVLASNTTVFDYSQEHLEGLAYELTDACKVWWSNPFKLAERE